MLQFVWRPTIGLDTKEGLVVSTEAKVYTAVIGEELEEYETDAGHVTAVAWSQDGSLLAVGSKSPSLHVENFSTGKGFTVELASKVKPLYKPMISLNGRAEQFWCLHMHICFRQENNYPAGR